MPFLSLWLTSLSYITAQGLFLMSETGVASNLLQTQCLLRRGLSPGSLAWPTHSLFTAACAWLDLDHQTKRVALFRARQTRVTVGT